MINFALQL